MADIIISEFMDDAAVTKLSRKFDVVYDPKLIDRPQDLLEMVVEARGLIVRNRTQVRGALLENCRALRVVGRLGIGLDNIDLEGCRQRNIQVFPASGANTTAVKEYVIGALLTLFRHCFDVTDEVLAGSWPRERLLHKEISGHQLGLIGFGNIAREVAFAARALGMTVAACDPYIGSSEPVWSQTAVTCMTFEELLSTSDAVSLHVPMTAQTRNIIDAQAISLMRPASYLINSSRGGIVDETALADALRRGALAGAVLDVFEEEPLPPDSVLAGVPNIVLTPHVAGVTEESNRRVSALTAENVRRVLQGNT